MTLGWHQIADIARAALSDEERRSGVLYLDRRQLDAGSEITLGRDTVTITASSAMAFVDAEPMANWGHACRYLLIDASTGAVRSFPAQMPPFLRGAADTLRVIAKGSAVPDWTLAAPIEPPPR
jgi:hypothetical protein